LVRVLRRQGKLKLLSEKVRKRIQKDWVFTRGTPFSSPSDLRKDEVRQGEGRPVEKDGEIS
jgi:hypothetical protein